MSKEFIKEVKYDKKYAHKEKDNGKVNERYFKPVSNTVKLNYDNNDVLYSNFKMFILKRGTTKNGWDFEKNDFKIVRLMDILCEYIMSLYNMNIEDDEYKLYKFELICTFLLGSSKLPNLYLTDAVYDFLPQIHEYIDKNGAHFKKEDNIEKYDSFEKVNEFTELFNEEYKQFKKFEGNLPHRFNSYLQTQVEYFSKDRLNKLGTENETPYTVAHYGKLYCLNEIRKLDSQKFCMTNKPTKLCSHKVPPAFE